MGPDVDCDRCGHRLATKGVAGRLVAEPCRHCGVESRPLSDRQQAQVGITIQLHAQPQPLEQTAFLHQLSHELRQPLG